MGWEWVGVGGSESTFSLRLLSGRWWVEGWHFCEPPIGFPDWLAGTLPATEAR